MLKVFAMPLHHECLYQLYNRHIVMWNIPFIALCYSGGKRLSPRLNPRSTMNGKPLGLSRLFL
jgi:hypothetical protein